MEIIGRQVQHKTFGLGRVTGLSGSLLTVMFESRERESAFLFPDAFMDHLSFTDITLQKQVEALLALKYKPQNGVPPTKAASPGCSAAQHTEDNPPSRNIKAQPKSRLNSFVGTAIPSTAVLSAGIRTECGNYTILIVTDASQQDSAKGIYWKNRTLSKAIMEAHFSGHDSFSFDGKLYHLESITKYIRYNAERNKWVRFNSITEAKDLYIFKQKGIYDNPENGYELVDAKLYFPQKRQAIKVAVYYQADLSRFFMNEESFLPLVRAHGMPNAELHFTEDTSSNTPWVGKFSQQSKLKMLGYNVQQAEGLSSGERQNLLSSIIRSGQMTDAEVTNHLEMLLHLNSGKDFMFDACGAWREDLEFVRNNFGDMRRQKDFYGAKPKTSSSASQRQPERPRASSIPDPVKPQREPKEPFAKTDKPQIPIVPPEKPDPRMPLLKKRAQLISELASATGLFNFFKRIRLKREIRKVENELNECI